MLIDQVSLSSLRVFESVYRLKSMSLAANELFMTQPGVSQNIKNLEQTLDLILFDRIARKLIPTNKAHLIYPDITETISKLETSLSSISKTQRDLKGTIRLGMPIEFGNNVILPLLAKWCTQNPDVDFQIHYDHVARQVNQILDGTLDFAITDTFAFPKQLDVKNLSKEHLVLCAGLEYAKSKGINAHSPFKKLKDLDFISYLEGAPVLKQWVKHHQGRNVDFNVRARLMDVQGVSRLIVENVGIGVLSMHMVRNNNLQDSLVIFEGSKKPLYNGINLVNLRGKSMGQATLAFIDYLRNSFD